MDSRPTYNCCQPVDRLPAHVVVLSPHIDDAAFSLAVTLRKLASSGSHISILNCFTNSRFIPFQSLRDVNAINTRHDEEATFLHYLGGKSHSHSLGLPEAPLRGGIRNIRRCYSNSRDVEALVLRLQHLLPTWNKPTILLAPLAIGDHTDHYIVREAVLAKYAKYPIAFYEDQPYAAAAPTGQIEALVAQLLSAFPNGLHPLTISRHDYRAWKQTCCQVYKSQISAASIDRILDYGDLLSGERLWGSHSFIESFTQSAQGRVTPV